MSQRQYLKDYRPPDFLVPEVALDFDIRDDAVTVCSRLQLRRQVANADLVLDGRGMGLTSVAVDGRPLAPDAYAQTEEQLRIPGLPAACELAIEVEIDPYSNSSLEGLYDAKGMLCTQCESHGFSRITYFPDRPDVLSVYRVSLTAAADRFPVLLSNGERESLDTLDDGRQRAVWFDPHPKPCYLFAAVAGDLASAHADYTTGEGRKVAIDFYCDHGIEDRLDHAIDSLQRSMRWDEEVYGRHYDLDTYSVVVAGAFNMGAMENKGLNIFNPKYVLASPDTATDTDFADVEAVIAHEYFHNWSGNRVTCRDWFQLSLKEGLTVFREQQFSADAGAGPAQRIGQVRLLRARQFAEDAGPLAHPVRPESYVEMNNFYTITVYEKGAELVRMLHARVGKDGFRRGMDLYFERHDGQAATIEAFLDAHAQANQLDLSGILRWYGQAGTPRVELRDEWVDGEYRLEASQSIPSNPGAKPVSIPIRMEWLDDNDHRLEDPALPQRLDLEQATQTFKVPCAQAPVPVFFTGLSAPVNWDYPYTNAQLHTILRGSTDPFARWDAAQRLFLAVIDGVYAGRQAQLDTQIFTELLEADGDGAVLAELLSPPTADALADRYPDLDPLALCTAIDTLEQQLADALGSRITKLWPSLTSGEPYRFEPAEASRRRLAARLLRLWLRSDDEQAVAAALALYAGADNLTDRMAALGALNYRPSPTREQMLNDFFTRYADDRLVLDRWFALRASIPGEHGLEASRLLLEHPKFDYSNPNRVRAVLGSFAMSNPAAFYAGQGAGVDLLAGQIQHLDGLNPQLASRLLTPLANADQLAAPYRDWVHAALAGLAQDCRSPDVLEQVNRILGR